MSMPAMGLSWRLAPMSPECRATVLCWWSPAVRAQGGRCRDRPHFTEQESGLPEVTQRGDAWPGAGAGGQARAFNLPDGENE